MKILRILLFAAATLFIGCPPGYSQLRYFLPDSNAYFSVSPYKFWFQGDTAIESKVYKKVFMQDRDSLADFTRATYYAAVREDTLEERIYCIQTDDGIERLIADFSLNPGDTVTVYTFWPADPQKTLVFIDGRDSIEIDGNYRKRLIIDWGFQDNEYWIEGIGSMYGLFFPGSIMYSLEIDYPILLCVQIEDEIIYDNPDYEGCYLDIWVGIDDDRQKDFSIFPSPSNDKIYITENNLISNQPLTYEIINMQGIYILHGILTYTSEIDVSVLKPGMYMVCLTNRKDHTVFSTRFIKY